MTFTKTRTKDGKIIKPNPDAIKKSMDQTAELEPKQNSERKFVS